MTNPSEVKVLVQVVPVESGRETKWGSNKVQGLGERLEDIKAAIASGARAIANSLETLPHPMGWRVSEVSGSFGLSLAAETGVILTKASAEATFEVTVTFEHAERSSPADK